MRVLVFVLPKWAESRFQTKFVGTHGRKLITKFEWKISGNFAKYFAQCHLGNWHHFQVQCNGKFSISWRESGGVEEEKRNYLGSTWKWIADRVKSRTEEALDTMAEGKGDMKLKLEIQMQIETDKRLVNPKATYALTVNGVFAFHWRNLVSPDRHFGQFGSLLKVKCVKMAN